ncbi:laminin G domain-containing protein [Dactylosporangium sp. AC04546]|uniref:laminin G domain-containing protein n=1 Tax=Dactylosporangium sp. AC04546 TaxID=2862460 RepID=UPI001EE1028F|nr:laminin G domain-containing protein [Dactylosporangium sp. AC04546]WVK89263.1 laminin G domain-containing protein [Dactylosporangium sp. AC04546]
MVAGTATTADATSGTEVAVWQMNEAAGARTMLDSSGHGLHGRIGGEVVAGGGAYRFSRLRPDTPPTHPQHVVTVPDAPALDPGDRDYAVTVRLRTTHSFGNIVQKGQATVAGGNWKLQIPSGIVQCLFRGSRGSVIVSARTRINDGAWHTVRCERTQQGLTLTIDGRTDARRAGRTGTIANSWPVSVGGKTACDQVDVGCDYYAGDLDYVAIESR